MCGICGIAYADPRRSVERARISRMTATLVHRGPDDCGVHIDNRMGMGHRRLSIVDVSGGQQPISNEEGTVWVSCNGEIYNHEDLRAQLIQRGHHYRSFSDSETIVHLYEEHGLDAVKQLRGMFAFAIWDARVGRLILARDRFGIKPLYYWESPNGDLVWASEIKALFASEHVQPALNGSAFPEYLVHRYTTGSETLFREIRRAKPGHLLVWKDARTREQPYWRLSDVIGNPLNGGNGTGGDFAAQFEHKFNECIRMHLMSDVPVGAFLSGGLDSSAVAAVMSDTVGSRLKTFSVGYRDNAASELAFARTVADHLHSDHHEVVVTPDQFFEALPRLIWHEDEPIAFPSSVPLHFIAALARKSVKVVLTGEGSDEILAGYGKYWRTLWNLRLGGAYERLPRGLRNWTRRTVNALPDRHRTTRRLQRTFLQRPLTPEGLFFDNFGAFSAADIPQLLGDDFSRAHPVHGRDLFSGQRRRWSAAASGSALTRMLHVDTTSYLHELLMKQDQMSMAASIESRVPFLDHELVELAFGLPDHAKLRGTRTKIVLREMMAKRLPREILRRPKMGFPTPVGRWLATSHWDWVEEYALAPDRLTAHFFDSTYVERIARQHRQGQIDHTERLWAVINTELWARHYPGVADCVPVDR